MMHLYSLRREQWVARSLERLFPFFARPENLALITPPSLGFRLLTPQPVVMEKGRVIDYTLRILGLPTRWRTLISRYEPPWCFVDEQLCGPYSFWHHTHRFEPRDGGTLLHDEVHYALPVTLIGPARELVHTLYVRPALERIFDYRRQVYARLFSGIQAEGAHTFRQAPASEENTA
jgi:ligand-binding SRPBCC domain-containing protein